MSKWEMFTDLVPDSHIAWRSDAAPSEAGRLIVRLRGAASGAVDSHQVRGDDACVVAV